jgi:L-asparaginase/Glu-tRNA(Gln) amidotransferase subunit D
VRGIILNLYHSGTANVEEAGESVAKLVEDLRRKRGIVFFGVTENGEPVDLHAYETSVRLREAGVVPLYDMLRDVALAKLRLMDGKASAGQLIEAMLHNDVGEVDEQQIITTDISDLKRLYEK